MKTIFVLSLVFCVVATSGCATMLGASLGRREDERKTKTVEIPFDSLATFSRNTRISVLMADGSSMQGYLLEVKPDSALVLWQRTEPRQHQELTIARRDYLRVERKVTPTTTTTKWFITGFVIDAVVFTGWWLVNVFIPAHLAT